VDARDLSGIFVRNEGVMELYPRNANKFERGDEVGNAFLSLIEENLEIERWGFRLTFSKFLEPRNIIVIYDSKWCRMRFLFSRMHYPETDEILIEYGRLHAPNERSLILWEGEMCHCWHNILDPLRFLDGLTPKEAYEQTILTNQLPSAVRYFRDSPRGVELLQEYPPKSVIVLHSTLWKTYEKKLFELFDMRRHYLWEEYREFLRGYYRLLGLKSSHPPENVC
jgi:hypothetical protein